MKFWSSARTLVIASMLVAGAVGMPALGAHAADNGTTASKGCYYEDRDDKGNVTLHYVAHGTRVGMLYCRNGEWVFGTIVLDAAVPTEPTGSGPLTTTLRPDGVLVVSSVQR